MIQKGKPTNYQELKKKANSKCDWRERLAAVEELGNWNCRESKDILRRRMISDKVFKVQETAFRKLQALEEDVRLPRKKKGNLIKNIQQTLSKVKSSLPPEHSYDDFKNKFKDSYPEHFDTYEGDKGSRFEQWLQTQWSNVPVKK
ncbi:HEAT repeat domain-containing protein [Bacillus altitudinis]